MAEVKSNSNFRLLVYCFQYVAISLALLLPCIAWAYLNCCTVKTAWYGEQALLCRTEPVESRALQQDKVPLTPHASVSEAPNR
jgi:hypothetical protein